MEYEGSSQRRGFPAWAIALLSCGGCFVIIIAIAAAVFLPVFAKARRAARSSTCMSNLKDCALAVNMYANDYGGLLPHSPLPALDELFETGGLSSGGQHGWPSSVASYTPSNGHLTCPSDGGRNSVSYVYKHAINLAARHRINKGDFRFPSQQILLYERENFHQGGGAIANGAAINAAFVDGHVRIVRMHSVAPNMQPKYFNERDVASPTMSRPYWDPRYCYDDLP